MPHFAQVMPQGMSNNLAMYVILAEGHPLFQQMSFIFRSPTESLRSSEQSGAYAVAEASFSACSFAAHSGQRPWKIVACE